MRARSPAGESWRVRLRLVAKDQAPARAFGDDFSRVLDQRRQEADRFYQGRISHPPASEEFRIMRQAHAGLLWSKQFFNYEVVRWLKGDPTQPPPPAERQARGRNWDWPHIFNRDVLSMPDTWEYPWYAAWDLAFHTVELARIDAAAAKVQLIVLLREWYMHPNGALPAYEFAFSDVNPPVHAWAVWRVYKITGARGHRDIPFLESAFQKLLMNFTWWINRKDSAGRNLFSGGFLGLDNIGVFDRSKSLGAGNSLEQADGTAWMASYCLTMLNIATELACCDPVYEDIASKFFEHFVHITDAINRVCGGGLWDEEDGFYYDRISLSDGRSVRDEDPLPCRPAAADRGFRGRQREGRRPAEFPEALSLVHAQLSRVGRPRLGSGSGRFARQTQAHAGHPVAPAAGPHAALHARRKRISLRRMASAPSPATTRNIRLSCRGAIKPCRSITTPATAPPACSAAIPTGAARSGFRSIT